MTANLESLPLKHSVAGIAIEQGRVFIARRKAGGDLGGKWEFPGGKVEVGEDDAHALRREFLEEFGIAVTAGPLLASGEFFHDGKKFALNGYRVFPDFNHFRMTEHDECRWAALDELKTLDFADSDEMLLPQLRMYLHAQPDVEKR